MLKIYFCVQTECYDNGQVMAALLVRERGLYLPESTVKRSPPCRATIYWDWFTTFEEAETMMKRINAGGVV
jgi:hypothetical protein